MDEEKSGTLVPLVADVVCAYVANNSVPMSDLTALISTIHESLAHIGQAQAVPAAPQRMPAVPIKRSITPDYLISLEDGRQYKSLKRHLAGRGLTPDAYREKWGLARDYPMVAPNYAKHRSELARTMGLGKKKLSPAPETNGGRRGRKAA